MKTIDIKSLIIGALLASTILLGVAATHNIEGGGINGAPIKVEVTLKNGSGFGDAKFDFGK